MELPEGLTVRPLTEADARTVFEVIAAQELHDLGRGEIEEADIVGDWQRPSFDVSASTVGIFDDDHLVAYAQVGGEGRGEAAVHPQHRGRGLGTARALLADAFANARDHGATRSNLATASRTGALGLYERVGMVVTGTWVHRAVDLRQAASP